MFGGVSSLFMYWYFEYYSIPSVCALLWFSCRRAQMRAGAMNLDSEGGEAGEQGLKKVSCLAAGQPVQSS